MKKTLIALVLCMMALMPKNTNAQPPSNNAVIPLYIHVADLTTNRQGVLDAAFDMVCSANDNFYRRNGVKVSFYIANIDQATCGTGTAGKGIHVYVGLCSCSGEGCTNGTTIKIGNWDEVVFTHELGHALSLGHPLGGPCPYFYVPNDPCFVPTNSGDADCISDTSPTITGNWMNSGSPSGNLSTFTSCQKHVVEYSAYMRSIYPDYWPVYPSSPLRSSANYVVPIQRVDINYSRDYAKVTFDYSNLRCNGTASLPANIICELHTNCTGNEAVFTYNMSLGSTYYIPKCWGINYVLFKYGYPSSYHINRTDIQFTQSSLYVCACTLNPPAPDSKGVNLSNSSRLAHTITIMTDRSLTYSNTGFNRTEVYDINGRILLTERIHEGNGNVDISSLSSGIYIFKAISNDGDVKVIRFMKQ